MIHTDLDAYKAAYSLALSTYEVTNSFPNSEKFGLVSQLRRASISVPVNIAEGAGKNSPKSYLSFLFIARGSLSEMETLLKPSHDVSFLHTGKFEKIEHHRETTTKLLNGLINHVKSKVV